MKNRLLFVVNDIEFFISHRLPIAIAAKKSGFEVHLAAAFVGNVKLIHDAGIIYHKLNVKRGRASLLADTLLFFELLSIYKAVKPQIVHHVTIKPLIFGGIVSRLTRVPAVVYAFSGLGYVFIDQGIRACIRKYIVKLAYRISLSHKNGKVIFQNPDDNHLFLNNKILKEENTTVIAGSGVDLNIFHPSTEPDEPPVVLLVSRMIRDKGICEFVESAKTLKEEGFKARFVLVGDNKTENPSVISTSQLEEWQKNKIIEWWGRRDNMQNVFSNAHIVCLPSYREGLPKVLIEAAASGKPIVTTNVPGCREVVTDGYNGLLVSPRDSKTLTTALKKLIANRKLRVKMGIKGRKIAEQQFSIEKIVGQILEIYSTLLSKAGIT